MTKGELLKELEDLDDDAVIYVTGCTETADVQNEITLVCG